MFTDRYVLHQLAAQVNETVLNGSDDKAAAIERAKLFIGRDARLKATVFHSLKPFPDIREIAGETDYTGFGCYKYLQVPTTGDLLDGEVSAADISDPKYVDYKPKFEERFYLWPIPQGEIDKAGDILVQNPDYKK